MLQENLDRFRFARAIGAYGTGEPRQGLRYLDRRRNLIVYPEGQLRPPGPPRDLAPGAAWFARAAKVPLYAVATRTLLRGHQYPEAYLSFHRVDTAGSRSDVTARLDAQLSKALSELDDLVAGCDPRAPLPGFTLTVAGRRSPDERIEAMTRSVTRRLRWRG
jgi:hypothetical protein